MRSRRERLGRATGNNKRDHPIGDSLRGTGSVPSHRQVRRQRERTRAKSGILARRTYGSK